MHQDYFQDILRDTQEVYVTKAVRKYLRSESSKDETYITLLSAHFEELRVGGFNSLREYFEQIPAKYIIVGHW